jgi:hypothetical protein
MHRASCQLGPGRQAPRGGWAEHAVPLIFLACMADQCIILLIGDIYKNIFHINICIFSSPGKKWQNPAPWAPVTIWRQVGGTALLMECLHPLTTSSRSPFHGCAIRPAIYFLLASLPGCWLPEKSSVELWLGWRARQRAVVDEGEERHSAQSCGAGCPPHPAVSWVMSAFPLKTMI